MTAPWVDVCAWDGLTPDRGVRALVDGRAVAVFRCSPDDALFAVGDVDPYTGASVISRGLVGGTDVAGTTVRFVASPLRKQRFDLASGHALEDPSVGLGRFAVRRSPTGRVEVRAAPG